MTMRLSFLALLCFFLIPAFAESEKKNDTDSPPAPSGSTSKEEKKEETYKIPDGQSVPVAEVIDENHIKIGLVTINKKDRNFSIPAIVNMNEGLIEYMVSMPHGKLHETLFVTMADPLHMSVASKLLDFKSFKGMFPERDENLEWKPYKEPKREQFLDSLVDITASWEVDGKKTTLPVSKLIKFKATDHTLSSHEWALIDSVFYKKTYQASVIGDVVSIFGDINSLITYTGFGNDGENIWLANPKLVPKPGTEVTITFKKLPRKEAEKPVARRPKDVAETKEESYLN